MSVLRHTSSSLRGAPFWGGVDAVCLRPNGYELTIQPKI
jgi:hypothetical protein